MLLKTILNRVHKLKGFRYGEVKVDGNGLSVALEARKGSQGICSGCGKKGPAYDTAREARRFAFVPLWGIAIVLLYHMRRISCRRCDGVKVERIPWADGKNQTCNAYRAFLATWARRMSWSEVGRIFSVSWGVVFRSIEWVVDYGMAHRSFDNVTAIGIDEMAMWKGHKYVTVVYQIDNGLRRLLWIGRDRTEATLTAFFKKFGNIRCQSLKYIASDMWKPYLNVVHRFVPQAIHVLDRFHIVAKLHQAVDEVRRKESRELAAKGYDPVLKNSRWCFLKRRENLTNGQREKLSEVLQYDLRSVRAHLLKESFEAFWRYSSAYWAGWFLDKWCARAMRSRLPPIKKFVGTLRSHRKLLLNWFAAKKEISSGVVEGLNANAKLALRKARGFKSYRTLEIALYHQLGKLPEPAVTHRFC